MKAKPQEVKIDLYSLVRDAAERGVNYGACRAFKYIDCPKKKLDDETWAALREQLESEFSARAIDAVMNELSEIFIWPERYET